MPEVDVGGCRLHFTIDGTPGAPILLFSNSLGTTIDLWTRQLPVFVPQFRVVRYDTRGHGRSDVPAGDYTLDQLGADALAVLEAVGAGAANRAHFCGISLGGMVGMWLAVHAAHCLDRLVLADTGARIGTPELWNLRMQQVRDEGMGAIADASMMRWFTHSFHEREPVTVRDFRAMVASCPADAYLGCSAAIRDADLRDVIGRITAPALVLVGASDPSTTPVDAEFLHEHIPGARLVTLEAAHLSNVEAADAFNTATLAFLLPR